MNWILSFLYMYIHGLYICIRFFQGSTPVHEFVHVYVNLNVILSKPGKRWMRVSSYVLSGGLRITVERTGSIMVRFHWSGSG